MYSGHNDHNYFEIAHTVQRTNGMVPAHIKLYNFVDNHDVERIHTKLMDKAHFLPVHILLYTLPGIPSVYYGSEFGIDGRKERGSDDSLRPYIELNDHSEDYENNPCTRLIAALGSIHRVWKDDLVWGEYRQLGLTTRQYAFQRGRLIVAVNNSDGEAWINVEAHASAYVGLLSGRSFECDGGRLSVCLPGCSGDIFAPDNGQSCSEPSIKIERSVAVQPKTENEEKLSAAVKPKSETQSWQQAQITEVELPDISYDLMTVEQLQAVILSKMAKNGPVTERMRREVIENTWHNSLVNWANSFR